MPALFPAPVNSGVRRLSKNHHEPIFATPRQSRSGDPRRRHLPDGATRSALAPSGVRRHVCPIVFSSSSGGFGSEMGHRKDEAAPNPWAGVGLAWALSLAMVVFSVAYWIFHHPPPFAKPNVFFWVISNRPSELATGPLLGSIVPAAIAIFKFVTAGFIMRGNAQELPPLSRSPLAALAGAVLALISLSGSIAGLIRFFFWMKEP